MLSKRINQNAQYTFKYNASMGRHGWLRLTPAYSVRLVEEILSDLKSRSRVLEPRNLFVQIMEYHHLH